MITPRRITLTTVPGLRALHQAIAGACASPDVRLLRATVVLVPTRAAASQLRRTIEDIWLPGCSSGPRAAVLPDILTRGEWYRRLHALARQGRLLSDVEREVMLAGAAQEAIDAGHVPPFRMRPGLVAGMLAFYDVLGRQQRSVEDFARIVTEDLEPRAEFDRGAERLLRQTRFLAAAFAAFEARMTAEEGLDEHRLRQRLLAGASPVFRRVVVAMGDRVSEAGTGLYPADFDLLSRLPHLESVDVIGTRAAVQAGLGERLRQLLPDLDERTTEAADEPPLLVRPPGGADAACFVSRDREEELRDIARRIKREMRAAGPGNGGRTAVVYRRPLPYVYLAQTVFAAAGMQYQAADALPLAAEPFAAALDLVFAAVTSRFTRTALLQLLRSPHYQFADDGCQGEAPLPLGAKHWDALDSALAEAGYLGGVERLRAFAAQAHGSAAAAARAALAAADRLAPLLRPAPASAHLQTLMSFVRRHERRSPTAHAVLERHLRARAAALTILEDLRAASLRYHDPRVTIAALAPSIRRWLESQTFTPAQGHGGVELIDASAARYGRFDDVHLAGLVSGDWPQADGGNIFYPAFLLSRLGWPPDSARVDAERALFADLLGLARRRVRVSSFTLEDDAIVEPSPLLEDLEAGGLAAVHEPGGPAPRIFADEALTTRPTEGQWLDDRASAWLHLRAARSPAADPVFHGFTGEPAAPAQSSTYTVTGIDRYLECPFKYFARGVLNLPEENADEQGLSPKARGRFVHEVLRAFFAAWQAEEGGNIPVDRLDSARSLFARVAEEQLTLLPPSEALLERIRLLGSPGAPGLCEMVLASEAVRPALVRERLLEFPFDGEFTFSAGDRTRTLRLRGKADRVDVLADGRLRIVDYKIGRAPEDAVQLPMYMLCVLQQLRRDGRPVEVGEAFYVAFGQRSQPVEVVIGEAGSGATAAQPVLARAQERVMDAVDGIERGHFPPRPSSPRLCATCAYAAVCRKDYASAD